MPTTAPAAPAPTPTPPVPAPVVAGQVLLEPGCLVAMAVLVVNDHWLKARFGPDPRWGLVTGKVSDVAGLVFFPLLLVSLVELVELARWLVSAARRPASASGAGCVRDTSCPSVMERHLLGAVVATGAGFAAVQVVPAAAAAYSGGLAVLRWAPGGLVAMCTAAPWPPLPSIDHVMDATDCLSLPALWLSHRVGRRHLARHSHRNGGRP